MEKERGLLAKRDTDFVRENMLINYCLGDEDDLLIDSFVQNNELPIRFDVSAYYFFMTGVHKKYVPRYTPQTFGMGVDRTLHIYDLYASALRENGYDGNVFLIKTDNSKQVGVLFSAKAEPRCTPLEMAGRLHALYLNANDPYFARRYMSTSFVGPYGGYARIHEAFLAARALNDLLFFGVRDAVITEEYRREHARPCGVSSVVGNYRRLLTNVCTGTLPQALRQAEHIVSDLVAPSFSMEAFRALSVAFGDLLSMHETVYGLSLPAPQADDLLTLAHYRAYMRDSLRALFRQLEGRQRYSPTILMTLSCIRQNFTRELSLAQLSEYAYANPSTLSSEFNAEVGVSLTEYVAQLRVERAKTLLASTGSTVAQVARQSGFSGEKYFRELFKRQTGMTPQAYRAAHGAGQSPVSH